MTPMGMTMAKASTTTRTIPIATTVFFSMMLKLLCSFIGAPAPFETPCVLSYCDVIAACAGGEEGGG